MGAPSSPRVSVSRDSTRPRIFLASLRMVSTLRCAVSLSESRAHSSSILACPLIEVSRVSDGQAPREIAFRHLAGGSYDRLYGGEGGSGQEVRPAHQQHETQETDGGQNKGELLQDALDGRVGFARLYHPCVRRGGSSQFIRGCDWPGVDIVIRAFRGPFHLAVLLGLTVFEHFFPDGVVDLSRRKVRYVRQLWVRHLTKNLALSVPDDDDDVTARGGLRQFVLVLA